MKILRVLCATLESFAVNRKNTISLAISPFDGVIHHSCSEDLRRGFRL